MKRPFLLTCDLHFSDKPSDAARFGIFPWLEEKRKKYNADALFVLGDLTVAKDRHSSKLVNKIVDGFRSIDGDINILMGNHDYIAEGNPFFKFMSHIERIRFITKACILPTESGTSCLMIPHCKEWPDLKLYKGSIHYIMLHQTIEGAIAESGARLNGLKTGPLEAVGARNIFSGDIHRPQVCGPVVYAGAPYNVRFGDNFKPRVLLVDPEKDKITNLYFPSPRKHKLVIREHQEILDNEELKPGDHVKIEIQLAKSELIEWPTYKRQAIEACKTRELEIFGVELLRKVEAKRVRLASKDKPKIKGTMEVFKEYCKREKVTGDIKAIGYEILKG